MTEGGRQEAISQPEFEAFATRLETWGQDLPAKEQAMLRIVLTQAASGAESDVAGHASLGPSPLGAFGGSLFAPLAGRSFVVGSDTFTFGNDSVTFGSTIGRTSGSA